MTKGSMRGPGGVWTTIVCAVGLSSALAVACSAPPPQTTMTQRPLTPAEQELNAATSTEARFYALDDAAKESFAAGDAETARQHAEELLALLQDFRGNWNYGNAVHDANLVLGRIAVLEGRIADARQLLLAAGRSPGSPQLDTFGPDMSLAKDLLEQGEADAVLEYLRLCKEFWELDYGKLDSWSRQIRAGEVPDFGENLGY